MLPGNMSFPQSPQNTHYYDPSYGTGPFKSDQQATALAHWENASVQAFGYAWYTANNVYPEPELQQQKSGIWAAGPDQADVQQVSEHNDPY